MPSLQETIDTAISDAVTAYLANLDYYRGRTVNQSKAELFIEACDTLATFRPEQIQQFAGGGANALHFTPDALTRQVQLANQRLNAAIAADSDGANYVTLGIADDFRG